MRKFHVISVCTLLILVGLVFNSLNGLTPAAPNELDKIQKLISSQNYCMELGDCLGMRTELKKVPDETPWYHCVVLHTEEAWYEEDLRLVKATCNAFARLGVLTVPTKY